MIKIKTQYNTTPNIFHFPGGSINHIDVNKQLFNRLQKIQNYKRLDKNITLITWNSYQESSWIEEYCQRNCDNYFILGKNIKNWEYVLKLHLLDEVLEKTTTDFILCLDAYDVFILNSNNIIKKFLKFNCNALFNSAYDFFPHHLTQNESITDIAFNFQHNLTANENKYLNSGAFIFNKQFIPQLKFIISSIANFDTFNSYLKKKFIPKGWNKFASPKKSLIMDDQFFLNHHFQHLYPQIQLDYQCDIFCIVDYFYCPKLEWGL